MVVHIKKKHPCVLAIVSLASAAYLHA